MAIQQAVLLIADIGGYTRFMTVHRINLAHAQDVVARLLESIIDAAGDFKLAKLEGDAAFFYLPLSKWPADLTHFGELVADIRRAFLACRDGIELDRMCTCDGCTQAQKLKLKFVAHVGEVAEQKVKRNRELAGVSVITVHRMLKNHVPSAEYLLMTEPLFSALPEPLRQYGHAQPEELEGLGQVTTHYVDLAEIAHVPPFDRKPTLWRKLRAWLGMTVRSLPYFLGLKKPCDDFRNMDAAIGKQDALPAPAPQLPPAP